MIPLELIVGTVMALGALAFVLAPLFTDVDSRPMVRSAESRSPGGGDPIANTFSLTCPACGPRPESDAIYCSSCGRFLGGPCAKCGSVLDQPGARFCAGCGHAVAA